MPIAAVPNFAIAAPEMFLAGAAMALLVLGTFLSDAKAARTVSYGCIAALIIAAVIVMALNNGSRTAFGGVFILDGFAAFMKVLILVSAAAVIVMARDYLARHDIDRFEFPILIVLATLGMIMMVSANDFIALYLGLELQSLALYVIASFQRDGTRSPEAGLKYFVLGALASGMLLYGMSLVYGFAGATGFAALAALFKASGGAPIGVIVGLVFIMAGLAFKVSAVPFHMWTPDVYEGAPTPVTALFAVAPKIAAMGLFIRVMVGPFGSLGGQWQQIVVFIAIASMVLGAVAAINQRNIKRLMAYSSIGNMGYALIGLAVAGETADAAVRADGIRNMLIFLAIYVFMNLGTFAVILSMRRGGRMVEEIDGLAGLSKTNPMMALALGVFMFSMAGIPPFAGFLGKLYIFQSAVQAELFGLAIIGVLASVVAAFYYIRIVKVMYFDAPDEAFDGPINMEMKTVLFVSFVFVTFFIVFPTPLLTSAAKATSSLLGG